MSRRGLNGRSVTALGNSFGAPLLAITKTLTGAETKNMFGGPAPYKLRVLRCFGVMLTAGTSSDTCVLQRVRDGSTASITDTADLSVLSDTDGFEFSQYNDANWTINKGDTLQAVTANGSTSTDTVQLTVEFCRVE